VVYHKSLKSQNSGAGWARSILGLESLNVGRLREVTRLILLKKLVLGNWVAYTGNLASALHKFHKTCLLTVAPSLVKITGEARTIIIS
jgi:hypothetical protein